MSLHVPHPVARPRWHQALATLWALVALVGCDGDEPAPALPTAAPTASFAPGDEVLIRSGLAEVTAGAVTKASATEVTVTMGDRETTVAADQVWRRDARDGVAVGSYVACHVPAGRGRVQQTHAWRVCRVDRLGSELAVTDYHGLEHEIALSDVAVPTAPVREEIERELEARAGRRAFDEAFSAAGEVRRPEGWIPAVGERVVVQFVPTSWYLAEVLARDDERVRVRFVGGTFDDRYVPASHVAPHPAGQPAGAPPPVDAWVLVPSARETERWQPARVVRSGAELEVALRGGDQRKLPARQVIVVE